MRQSDSMGASRPDAPLASPAGHSLTELLLAISILGILAAAAGPPLRGMLDAQAVRSARETLAAGFARTRSAAIAHGGARLIIEPAAARFRVETEAGDPVGAPVDLGALYGVAMTAGSTGDGGAVELRYDALGIGRVASRTIRLSRGRAEAGVTVSAYGRVRRW